MNFTFKIRDTAVISRTQPTLRNPTDAKKSESVVHLGKELRKMTLFFEYFRKAAP